MIIFNKNLIYVLIMEKSLYFDQRIMTIDWYHV